MKVKNNNKERTKIENFSYFIHLIDFVFVNIYFYILIVLNINNIPFQFASSSRNGKYVSFRFSAELGNTGWDSGCATPPPYHREDGSESKTLQFQSDWMDSWKILTAQRRLTTQSTHTLSTFWTASRVETNCDWLIHACPRLHAFPHQQSVPFESGWKGKWKWFVWNGNSLRISIISFYLIDYWLNAANT